MYRLSKLDNIIYILFVSLECLLLLEYRFLVFWGIEKNICNFQFWDQEDPRVRKGQNIPTNKYIHIALFIFSSISMDDSPLVFCNNKIIKNMSASCISSNSFTTGTTTFQCSDPCMPVGKLCVWWLHFLASKRCPRLCLKCFLEIILRRAVEIQKRKEQKVTHKYWNNRKLMQTTAALNYSLVLDQYEF